MTLSTDHGVWFGTKADYGHSSRKGDNMVKKKMESRRILVFLFKQEFEMRVESVKGNIARGRTVTSLKSQSNTKTNQTNFYMGDRNNTSNGVSLICRTVQL